MTLDTLHVNWAKLLLRIQSVECWKYEGVLCEVFFARCLSSLSLDVYWVSTPPRCDRKAKRSNLNWKWRATQGEGCGSAGSCLSLFFNRRASFSWYCLSQGIAAPSDLENMMACMVESLVLVAFSYSISPALLTYAPIHTKSLEFPNSRERTHTNPGSQMCTADLAKIHRVYPCKPRSHFSVLGHLSRKAWQQTRRKSWHVSNQQ